MDTTEQYNAFLTRMGQRKRKMKQQVNGLIDNLFSEIQSEVSALLPKRVIPTVLVRTGDGNVTLMKKNVVTTIFSSKNGSILSSGAKDDVKMLLNEFLGLGENTTGGSVKNAGTAATVATGDQRKRTFTKRPLEADTEPRNTKHQRVSEPEAEEEHDDDDYSNAGDDGLEDSPGEEEPEEGERKSNCQMRIMYFKCRVEECEVKPGTRSDYYKHLWNIHGIAPFRCLVRGCGQTFQNRGDIKFHYQDIHGDLTEWPCAQCSEVSVKTRDRLYKHVWESHERGQFLCLTTPECGFTATTRDAVRRHKITVHDAGKFNCSICSKSFQSGGHLLRHERIHLEYKAFRCTWPGCDHAAAQQNNAITHVRVQHFNLPLTLREQREKNIEDERDPKAFVQMVDGEKRFDGP